MGRFDGQHVIITGGSSGIGFHVAQELADRGADLTLIARDEAKLAAARSALLDRGGRVQTFACDVTDAAGLGRAVDAAVAALGRLDGVVANSGYCRPGRFHELPLAHVDGQVDTNLKGCLYTVYHAIPHLLAGGGGFIALTSSPAGSVSVFGFSVYGATKAALNNLAHVLRAEYGDRGIRVHLLLPPDTDTPGYAEEVRHYPRETRAILSGGTVFSAAHVAKTLVRGIEKGKPAITVGFESHLVLWLVRHAPWVWEAYVRWKKGQARRASPKQEDDDNERT